jgi:hypothetical protein
MKHKGYLCECCGKLTAKYEARSSFEAKSLLLCADCLTEAEFSPQPKGIDNYFNHSTSRESLI